MIAVPVFRILYKPVINVTVIPEQFTLMDLSEKLGVHLKIAHRFFEVDIMRAFSEMFTRKTQTGHDIPYFCLIIFIKKDIKIRHLPHSDSRVQALYDRAFQRHIPYAFFLHLLKKLFFVYLHYSFFANGFCFCLLKGMVFYPGGTQRIGSNSRKSVVL